MYVENKSEGGLGGVGRIGWVSFSKTGRTLRYRGLEFQSLKGQGYKANFVELASGDEYWISGPKRGGGDRLYGGGGVEVDGDAREAYWRGVRGFVGDRLPETA